MPAPTFELKKMFFDRPAVRRQLGEEQLKILRKLGGAIRKTARNSLKKKGLARKPPKRPGKAAQRRDTEIALRPASPAGSPPFIHTPDDNASLKKILFAYDGENSAVVGPVLLNGKPSRGDVILATTVPNLMEHGGSAGIREKLVDGQWVRRGRGAARGQHVRVRMAHYPARPTMAPALAKQDGKFADILSRSVSE